MNGSFFAYHEATPMRIQCNLNRVRLCVIMGALLAVFGGATASRAQVAPPPVSPAPSERDQSVSLPGDYVIGPQDVLGVIFWREPEMSGDVTVRPDGRISLPVIGDVMATGLSPDALQKELQGRARKYLSDPNVAVIVRAINSRKVFVTGRVTTPGAFSLVGPLTVMQVLALAGGITEYADAKSITILRAGGSPNDALKFNYKDVSRGKKLEQNVLLRPGDTVIVP